MKKTTIIFLIIFALATSSCGKQTTKEDDFENRENSFFDKEYIKTELTAQGIHSTIEEIEKLAEQINEELSAFASADEKIVSMGKYLSPQEVEKLKDAFDRKEFSEIKISELMYVIADIPTKREDFAVLSTHIAELRREREITRREVIWWRRHIRDAVRSNKRILQDLTSQKEQVKSDMKWAEKIIVDKLNIYFSRRIMNTLTTQQITE